MISTLHNLFKGVRFPLQDEKLVQEQIAALFKNAGIPFIREYRLDDSSIPDFMLTDGTAIEVKIKGLGARKIYRQCERYCKFSQVKTLVLITSKAMGFPETINDKPCYVINISKAWL